MERKDKYEKLNRKYAKYFNAFAAMLILDYIYYLYSHAIKLIPITMCLEAETHKAIAGILIVMLTLTLMIYNMEKYHWFKY